jgi:hypothetical protein
VGATGSLKEPLGPADITHVDSTGLSQPSQPSQPSRLSRLSRTARPTGERADIILGWLIRLVVVLGVLGVAAFDGLSIVATRLSLADTGTLAARAASTTWGREHNVQSAFDAAWAQAVEDDPDTRVETATFRIDPDATVHLVVRRHATTIVVEHVGWVAHWADVRVGATGRSVA